MSSAPYPPSPYQSPREEAARSVHRRAYRALLLALAPVLTGALGALFIGMPGSDILFTAVMALGVMGALAGIGIGLWSLWGLLREDKKAIGPITAAVSAVIFGVMSSGAGALVALFSMNGFSRGRQLRRRGQPLFANLEGTSAWLPETPKGAPGPAEVAAAWRTNGLTEHASVASFGRLGVELVALGAPPELIEAAYADAVDEMRHTELCFGLAKSLDGRDISPGPLPVASTLPSRRGPRPVQLAHLAVESLVDGALNEGVSARIIAELSKTVEEPRVKDILQTIARDEARHAQHGFDVVRWCLAEGGAPVAAALRGALPKIPVAPAHVDHIDIDAEDWGLPSQARLDRVYRTVHERLVRRTQRLLEEAANL